MKKTTLYIFAILSTLSFMISCQSNSEEPVEDFGTSFYPIQEGQFQTYLVRQTRFALNEVPEVSSYQLKEVIGEEFVGEDGKTAYEILRYTRPDGLDNFRLDSVFSIRKDKNTAIKMEHNIPYVKLNFPIFEGKAWDGNRFNARPEEEYLAQEVGTSKLVGNMAFDNTITVLQSQDSSLVDKDLRFEIYGDEVGLIYRKTESLTYCSQPECFGQKIIENGIISELIVFDWGVE